MKKRILSALTAIAIMFSMVYSLNIGALAFSNELAETQSATISVPETWGNPGDNVEIDIRIADNPGILGATITVSWDERLTLISDASGAVFGEMTYTPPSKYIASGTNFLWFGNEVNSVFDGVILKLVFCVDEDVQNNDILPIKVSYINGEIVDSKKKSVTVNINDGAIRAITYIPGDVNGDGRVNMLDLVKLSQYISDGCVTDPEGYNAVVVSEACDVDSNGRINILDLIKLSQYNSDGCVTDPKGYNVVLNPAKLPECVHSHMEKVEARTPTCTEAGNSEYWHCTKCGKYFADADGNNEINESDTVLSATGHRYSKAWSFNEEYHWHSATCGHTVTNDYSKHDFDEKNTCSVCGYAKPIEDYKDLYLKYSEIGKTVNLITASDFEVAPGAKRLFTNDIYNIRLDLYDSGKQVSEGLSYSSFEAFAEEYALNVGAKVSFGSRKDKNNRFMTNKLPSIDLSAALGYETKKASETSEYIYSWNYILGGTRVDIAEFQNREKLAGMLSPEFVSDALKVRNGEISAADFVKAWGTHVITSGIYGAKLNVNYFEVSNHVSDYSSYKANLDAKFNKRFLKTGLDIEATVDTSGISTSTEKDTLKWLSINGVAKNTFVCSSLDDLVSSYKTWQSNFEKDVAGNSVLVDIGDSGLCCIWYLLDDSFDDVKEILDDYMYSQCSDLYEQYVSKINGLKLKDDVTFDKETGTLEINFATYQKQGNIEGFNSDSYVTYDSEKKMLTIMPYYNGNQIKSIIINGAYKTLDSAGQSIDTLIQDVSIALASGNWYSGLQFELRNVGLVGSGSAPVIDLTAFGGANLLTITCSGVSEIIAHDGMSGGAGQSALTGNNILICSYSADDALTLKGGNGAAGVNYGDNGSNGGTGIIADNITVDMTGTLNVYGGNGGNGAAGENGRDGYNGGNSFWWSSNNGESGHDGGRGGDGGTGNLAVRSKSQILVINGTVRMYGGSSGNSGNGGNGGSGGNGSTAGAVGATGGRGGDAGRGGNSGDVTVGAPSSNCGYIISGNSGATVTSVIGDAGNIGTPGNAGNVGSGGGNGGWWGAHAGAAGSPASNGSDGRIIYDVTTAGVYNNADNGNVTHSIENGMLKITVSGEAAPGLGGFVQSTSSAPYKVFYHTIVAKVPVGYKLEHASNAIGDGAHFEWMTSNSGTGEFETYVYRTTCGSTGTFNDFGYVYLYADDYTTVIYPVEWYVSYANITE